MLTHIQTFIVPPSLSKLICKYQKDETFTIDEIELLLLNFAEKERIFKN